MAYFNKITKGMPLHMPPSEYEKVSTIPASGPYTPVNNHTPIHNNKNKKNNNNNIPNPDPNGVYMGTGHNGVALTTKNNKVIKLFFNNNYVPQLTKKLAILDKLGIASGITINGTKQLKNVYPPNNTNKT